MLCELIEAGFLYEAELYPERVLAFRHPLTREVAYGTQLADRRAATHAAAARATIELEPDRLDELAALIADHMEPGRRDARGGALVRPRRPLGRPQPAPGRDAPLAAGDRARRRNSTRARRRSALARALADAAARIRLAAGDGPRHGRRAGRRGDARSPTRTGDLRSLAAAEAADLGAPGRRRPRRASGSPPPTRRSQLADESGEPDLRVAVRAAPAPTRTCAPATSTASKRRSTRCSS